jgi:hypothetical protein
MAISRRHATDDPDDSEADNDNQREINDAVDDEDDAPGAAVPQIEPRCGSGYPNDQTP